MVLKALAKGPRGPYICMYFDSGRIKWKQPELPKAGGVPAGTPA